MGDAKCDAGDGPPMPGWAGAAAGQRRPPPVGRGRGALAPGKPPAAVIRATLRMTFACCTHTTCDANAPKECPNQRFRKIQLSKTRLPRSCLLSVFLGGLGVVSEIDAWHQDVEVAQFTTGLLSFHAVHFYNLDVQCWRDEEAVEI
jgi:hypothetical protein